VTRSAPITLGRMHVLYVSLVVLVVLPVVVLFAFSNQLYSAWCKQFEMPEYEKRFGFTMGPIPVTDPDGGTRECMGLTWVDAQGPLGRAGIRAGDFPRMYHGFGDFCGPLSHLAEGYAVQLEVINVEDLGKRENYRRTITVIPASQ